MRVRRQLPRVEPEQELQGRSEVALDDRIRGQSNHQHAEKRHEQFGRGLDTTADAARATTNADSPMKTA